MLLLVVWSASVWEMHTTSVETLALPSGTLLILLAIACHATSERLSAMATHAVGTGCVLVASAQLVMGVRGLHLLGLLAVGVLLWLLSGYAYRAESDASRLTWVSTARVRFTLAGCWGAIPLLAVEAHWPESSRLAAVASHAASCLFVVGTLLSAGGKRERQRAGVLAFALGVVSLTVVVVDIALHRSCLVATVFECCPWTRSIHGSIRLPCREPTVELHLLPFLVFALVCAAHVAVALARSTSRRAPEFAG